MSLDLNQLMAAGLGMEAKQLVQEFLELQEQHRRLKVVANKLRVDWEIERNTATYFKNLYEENLEYQRRLEKWVEEFPHAP